MNTRIIGVAVCTIFLYLLNRSDVYGLTAESLRGATVDGTVRFAQTVRKQDKDHTGESRWQIHLVISQTDAIQFSLTRTWVTPQGRELGSRTSSSSDQIGIPQAKGSGDHEVWLLDGETLTRLRTYEVGGRRLSITFSPDGQKCSLEAPVMHEAGAGNTRGPSILSDENVEIVSSKQIASTCQVSRKADTSQ
jgi:hypothetical protein